MTQNIKNKEEIILATDQVRGERISEKDKTLFFFEQRNQATFGKSLQDTIEFSVMDTENNLLYWEDKGLHNFKIISGQAGVKSVVLMPGDDLRRNGFTRGQFRINYNFFSNALGSLFLRDKTGHIIKDNGLPFKGNRVFIETISPTRKEIRILPVITGDVNNDNDFALQFQDFSDKLILGKDFADLTSTVITNFPGFDEFNSLSVSNEMIAVSQLRPIQTTFNPEKVNEMMAKLRIFKNAVNRTAPIDSGMSLGVHKAQQEFPFPPIVIRDVKKKRFDIIDGHHRWFAIRAVLGNNFKIPAIQFSDIDEEKEFLFRERYGELINAFQRFHDLQVETTSIPTVLDQTGRDIIINGIVQQAVKTVLDLMYDYGSAPEGYVDYFEDRLFEIVSPSDDLIDDSFRFLKYVINFGQNKNYLIVNWIRDDIEFPDAPFSIILKLIDPLPDEFEENDQLWISRELSPPVFEKAFLQGPEEEPEMGRFLRPPNFNIDVDNLGRRSTPFESFEDLVSTHATTSQQLVDHFFSGSLEGVNINVDFTDYSDFVHFGSATERLENFKFKLESIELLDSQITTLQNSTRSLNVLHDIQRLETKKTNLIGDFDRYEKFLFIESGSQYSASVPESQSAPFNSIGEWPKQNRIEPFVLFSVTSSEAEDWFDIQKVIGQSFDNENVNRLVNNTPVHIGIDEDNAEYILFLDMIGQYFDVFHSYITALGKLHNRDEDLFEGLSKDLTFNIVKSFGFDLENGNDFKPLWEHAFGFDISGSFNQSGDLVTGWANTSSLFDASFETFTTSSITATNVVSAINTVSSGAFQSNNFVNLPRGEEFEVIFDISGTLGDTPIFAISNVSASVFTQSLVTGNNNFIFSASANWSSGFRTEIRTTGSADFSLTDFSFRPVEGLIQSKPAADVTKEIWRRILNNLPYLLKTKGTARSIKALLTCYGIPQSILAIREYGGPDPSQFPRLQDRSSFVFEDFVHSIDFGGAQEITVPWHDFTSSEKPHTVELTFKTTDQGIATQSLINVTGSWEVSLKQTGSLFGKTQGMVVFEMDSTEITSSVFDFYSDDFFTVILTRTGLTQSLHVKKAEGQRFTYQSSASVILSDTGSWEIDSIIQLGSGSSNFSGSMKEFRLFQPALSESIFDNHVRWPRSYNSNDPTSSFDDLVLRYSFDEPKNHYDDPLVQDVKINQNFVTFGTASGFERGVNYTPTSIEFAALTTNLGANRFINNKVRIEDNELVFGNLNTHKRMEVSSFDFAPLDSNRLGIFFSPIDAINRDIIATFGGHDISEVLGQPSDIFETDYTGLKELNDFYFQKFTTPLDYNQFIRFLKRYDVSLFQQLKRLLPARADSTIGVLIEPHILERHKETVIRPIESLELLEKSASIDGVIRRDHSADLPVFDNVEIETSQSFVISSDLLDKEMFLTASSGDPSDYSAGNFWQQQGVIDVILPIEEVDTTHAAKKRDVSASDKLKYKGVLNTKETSIDGKEPIETFFTNPNRLVSVDEGPSKLKVE